MSSLLKFGRGNAKLGKNVYTFSLPAGFTCPGALECLSKANKTTGKLTDGPETKFRCFSATAENQYPVVRQQRWHNFDLLRKCKNSADMHTLICNSLAQLKNPQNVRIHVAGDFFSQEYFNAWCLTAASYYKVNFYFYTKSIPYWITHLDHIGNGRKHSYFNHNFIPTASRGGRHDSLIDQYNLREAKVVFSESEAKKLKLEIDHDDSHAMKFGKSFALLLHGTQPKGSEAALVWNKMKRAGNAGYNKSRRVSLPMTD